MTGVKGKPNGTPHPLDPLSAAEIRQAAAVCRAAAADRLPSGSKLRFNVISLQEPKKCDLLEYAHRVASGNTGENVAPARQAFCILQPAGFAGVVEVVVELMGSQEEGRAEQVVSWKEIAGVQALATPDDCLEAEAIAKADPEVRRLLQERYGVTDMGLVSCDPWSVHASPVTPRAIQCFMYLRKRPEGNQYAHPIDMVPIVDLTAGKVIRIDLPLDKGEDRIPWNQEENDYHSDLLTSVTQDPPKPIDITQPQGPSFTMDGNLVKWQKWQFRLGFNYREGIVLHEVQWLQDGAVRSVLHRLSLVEMAVPYADPREPYVRKCAFDVGDYGLGYCTFPLSLGCDCLGHIRYCQGHIRYRLGHIRYRLGHVRYRMGHVRYRMGHVRYRMGHIRYRMGHIRYFDATLSNSRGEPVTVPKAVCMHEEDAGLLYKHVDYRTGHNESRRMRRLVISHVATVVNYEYCFYWYLYQDGTISLDIKLTGELSTNMLSAGEGCPLHGTLVGPGVNAQHHQHMFCARIDPAIDDQEGGRDVVVAEVEVEALPWDAATNSHGNAFKVVETDLRSMHEAQRCIAPCKGRHWKLKNPQVTNPTTNSPVAYKLVPAAHPPLLSQSQSLITQKGFFATRQLWVTPHRDEQRWPAGEYVFGAKDCTGLKVWTKEDASLKGADPVVWYSFGVTHIVRPEDFPIMPGEVCGFQLKPCGFFPRNPCLDLPRDCNAASEEACSNGNTSHSNGAVAAMANVDIRHGSCTDGNGACH